MISAKIHIILPVWTMLVVKCQGSHINLMPCSDRPSVTSGPPPPALPEQFETYLEANNLLENSSTHSHQYNDFTGQRALIESYSSGLGMTVRYLINLNTSESTEIYDSGACKLTKVNTSALSWLGLYGDNNITHIKSVKDALLFGEDFVEVFVDDDKTVRGIPVNHWTACFKIPSLTGNCTMDYYFTIGSGYKIDGKEIQVPVRAELKCTDETNADKLSVHVINEFSSFKPGPIKDTVFQVPVGMICNNGNSSHDQPAPNISHHFSAGMEKVVLENDVEIQRQSAQLYIDYEANVYRMDVDQPRGPVDAQKFGNKPLIYISDFKTGVLYVIDTLEQNCSVSKLAAPLPPPGQGPAPPSVRPPTEFIDFFKNFSSFLYQGQKTWRGLPVYTWGYVNSSTQERTEVMFHKPQVPGQGAPNGPTVPGQGPPSGPTVPGKGAPNGPAIPNNEYEPVGIYKFRPAVGSMPSQTTYEHIYGFTNGHPNPEVFDVSSCYSMDHHSTFLALDVMGKDILDIVRQHQKEFVSAVRQTIASAAKISVTRIANIEWEEVRASGENKVLMISFLMMDNKLSGIDGTIYSGPSLSDALDNLQLYVNSAVKESSFDVVISTGVSVRLTVISGSLWELYSGAPPGAQQQTDSNKYSPGSMAGLGIGMLIVGALLGLIAAYVIYKRFDTSVPYQETS